MSILTICYVLMAHFAFAEILETQLEASKIIDLYDQALRDEQPTPATWVLNQLASKREEMESKKLVKEVIRKIHPDKNDQKPIDNDMFTRFVRIMNDNIEDIKEYANAKTLTSMNPQYGGPPAYVDPNAPPQYGTPPTYNQAPATNPNYAAPPPAAGFNQPNYAAPPASNLNQPNYAAPPSGGYVPSNQTRPSYAQPPPTGSSYAQTQVPTSRRMTRVFKPLYVPFGFIPRVYVPTTDYDLRTGHIPPTGRHVYIQPTGSPGYFLYIPHNGYIVWQGPIVYEKKTEENVGKADNKDRPENSEDCDDGKNSTDPDDDGEDPSEDSTDSDDGGEYAEYCSEDSADSEDSSEDSSDHCGGFWNSWFSCCRRRSKNN